MHGLPTGRLAAASTTAHAGTNVGGTGQLQSHQPIECHKFLALMWRRSSMQQAPVLGLLELVPVGSNGVCASRSALWPEVTGICYDINIGLFWHRKHTRHLFPLFWAIAHGLLWRRRQAVEGRQQRERRGRSETLPGCARPPRFWGWVLFRVGTAPIYIWSVSPPFSSDFPFQEWEG